MRYKVVNTFDNPAPGIAGAAVEEEPAIEKCGVAQILPQDVNEANRIEECVVDNNSY